ncbi:hypothetical protein BCV70DRAFT_38186 [Testicularia cyperi]|uniref:RNI-like protein n=1 Tax=Testicularia cyperi TaxID=1882483 RepID=A0A317XLW1_9BASI|nr:hypothetical protein BCV70DRAFT_38186 [Testicularia cyperi]
MVGESSALSVNERLARAREEDLRRQRNLRAREAAAEMRAAGGRPPLSTDSAATPDGASVSSSFASTSSSRAGLVYLASTSQAERERQERARARHLKRQVAGPIPPESWRDDFERLSIRRGTAIHLSQHRLNLLTRTADIGATRYHAGDNDDNDDNDDDDDNTLLDPSAERRYRRKVCAALRYHTQDEQAGGHGSMTSTRLSLGDLALTVIANTLILQSLESAPSFSAQQERLVDVLGYLPAHMRSRLMALCGSLSESELPLNDALASALATAADNEQKKDRDGNNDPRDVADDWEAEARVDDMGWRTRLHSSSSACIGGGSGGGGSAAASQASLDLSFADVSLKTLRRLAFPGSAVPNFSLRALSLAGWNSRLSLDSASILGVLEQLPNLEVLSLAGTRLGATEAVDEQRSSIFLRKLARFLPKLTVLDLSYCGWVSADSVCSVPWASEVTVAFPRLKHLVLTHCDAFTDGGASAALATGTVHGGDVFAGHAQSSFVGSWHAKHCQLYSPARAASTASMARRESGPLGEATRLGGAPVAQGGFGSAAPAAVGGMGGGGVGGGLRDPFAEVTHTNSLALFPQPGLARHGFASTAISFADYTGGAIQPAIVSHMSTSTTGDPSHPATPLPGSIPSRRTHEDSQQTTPTPTPTPTPSQAQSQQQQQQQQLKSFVRCPRSSGKVEMWVWQRTRALDALRGRIHPSSKSRPWIEVWF